MRALLAVLAFMAAFLAVNRFVVAHVPLPPESGLRTKTEYLLQHADEYDAILIGSSATLYGLRPRVFTEELERLGYPGFRLYNLGVGGMGSFETVAVLKRVLAENPSRLKWVFYEEPVFDSLLWYPDIVNQRYIAWHDAESTLAAIDALQYANKPPPYKEEEYENFILAGGEGEWRRGAAAEHIELGLRREFAVGQGPRIWKRLFGGSEDAWPSFEAIAATDGWMDITQDPAPGAKKAREEFLRKEKEWEKRIQNMIRLEGARPDPTGSYDLESLRDLIALIRGAGAEPIMYVPPRGLPSTMMMSLADRGEIPTLFPFHITTEYPELLPRDLHFDEGHLNPKGATLWSKAFARTFAEHLSQLPGTADAKDTPVTPDEADAGK